MSKFTSQENNALNLITVPQIIDAEALKDLSEQVKKWAYLTVKAHILDFNVCENLDPQMFRIMIWFKRQATIAHARIYSINLDKNLGKEIQNNGLDAVFNPTANIDAAYAQLGLPSRAAPPANMSVEFVKAFVSAVYMALTTQANTPLQTGKPYPKREPYKTPIGIAGVISLVSPQFMGSISLLFPTPVFLEIYKNMLDEKLETITKESEDAAGELLNIIFGLAKMKLNNEKGLAIQKAIPTVLVGDKLRVAEPGVGSAVVLPFETSVGPFFVEVIFEQPTAA